MCRQLIFSLLTISLLSGVISAQKGEELNILFIMDASGSMWARMDKSTRMAYAREVMTRLADKIPADAGVGLVAYGHTSESDCDDIATLIPLKTFDKTEFLSVVNGLQPKGKTPIARSIQFVLKEIAMVQQKVSIILVTDGLESCDGDACAQMTKARSEGRDLTMHVIGFGLAEENLSSLECLAQAGGGQFVSAANADALLVALEQSIQPPPAGNAFLSVMTRLEGKLKDASVKVIRTDLKTPDVSGRTYEQPSTNPRTFQLDPGMYTIEVVPVGISGLGVFRQENIALVSNDTVYKQVDFTQAILQVLVKRNGELSDATIQVFPAGSTKAIASTRSYTSEDHNPAILKVPPGTYDVQIDGLEISGKPSVRMEGLVMTEAGRNQITHEFVSGELIIGATQGTMLVDATISILNLSTGESVGAGRTYASASTNPKTFILQPGKYKVTLSPVKPAGLEKKSFEVEVAANARSERNSNW